MQTLAHAGRLQSMGEMASTLAHELSQPLAVVVNYANGLLRRLNESPVNVDSAREALINISSQARLTRRLFLG